MSTISLVSDDEDDSKEPQQVVVSTKSVEQIGIVVILVLDASRHKFNFEKKATLRKVANTIAKKLDIPREAQRLIYRGRELKSMTRNLAQLGVEDGQFIHLTTRQKVLDQIAKKSKALEKKRKHNTHKKQLQRVDSVGASSAPRAVVSLLDTLPSSASKAPARGQRAAVVSLIDAETPGTHQSDSNDVFAVSSDDNLSDSSFTSMRASKRRRRQPSYARNWIPSSRIERALSQRLYLISRSRIGGKSDPGGLAEEFKVLGSTGNVYTVLVNRRPSCTCPDALKGNICKHLYFVFLKVLKVEYAANIHNKRQLNPDQLEVALSRESSSSKDVQASAAVVRAVESGTSSTSQTGNVPQKNVDGEECAICFEELISGSGKEDLSFCSLSCGKSLHADCLNRWLAQKGSDAVCPYCRAQWPQSRNVSSNEGYLNYGRLAGLPRERPFF